MDNPRRESSPPYGEQNTSTDSASVAAEEQTGAKYEPWIRLEEKVARRSLRILVLRISSREPRILEAQEAKPAAKRLDAGEVGRYETQN